MQNRPVCLMVLSFCGGVFTCINKEKLPKLILFQLLKILTGGLWWFLAFTCMVLFFMLIQKKKIKMAGFVIVFLCILFFARGFDLTDKQNYFIQNSLPDDGKSITIGGTVKKYEIKENSTAIYLDKCVVYTKDAGNIKIGNKITVSGEVNRFYKSSNEGQFDEQTYYYGNGIYFSMFAKKIIVDASKEDKLRQTLQNLKEHLHKKLKKITNEKSAGIFQAMLLGEKKSVDDETKNLFMKGTIGHILVVSGLHFSIAGMAIFGIIRKIGGFFPAGIISIIILFLFGIMSGFSTSSIRAFVMFSVLMFSNIKGMDYDMPTALSLAIFFIVYNNPATLMLSGFILSVTAVLGIILVVPCFEKIFSDNRFFKTKIGSGIYTSFGIQIFTMPVMLYYYFSFNPYSLFINGIVLPFVPFILVVGIIATAVSLFSVFFAKIIIFPAVILLKIISFICFFAQKLPYFNIYPGKPGFIVCVAYYVLLFFIIFVFLKKAEKADLEMNNSINIKSDKTKKCNNDNKCGMSKKWLILFSGISLVFFIHKKAPLKITMLDVSQGQCIFIETSGGQKILYDGGSSDISNVGKYRIIPFLQANGAVALDAVFVSHLDEDHVSGINEILSGDEIKVKQLFLPNTSFKDEAYEKIVNLAKQKNIPVYEFGDGDLLKNDMFKLEGLHPTENFITAERNETSIVMNVSYINFDMLLCGDMEENAMKRIIDSGNLKSADVLQVAHHGSEYTTSEEFLDIVKPSVALISCGAGNRYGHPHKELLERLENIQSQIYITMNCGQTDILTDGDKYWCETMK